MSGKSDADNKSNQMNPNNDAYWQSRGYDEAPDVDNHADQLNPSSDAYWQSRGYGERPENWEEILEEEEQQTTEE